MDFPYSSDTPSGRAARMATNPPDSMGMNCSFEMLKYAFESLYHKKVGIQAKWQNVTNILQGQTGIGCVF
jgi:hypothetical protein